MQKKKFPTKKIKLNKIGFRSSISIYKEKFSKQEIKFKPNFSITITKNINFSIYGKIANNLAKSFKRIVLLKF